MWQWAIHYCAVYNFVQVPLEICSEAVQRSQNIMIINFVVDAFFILDIFVCFMTAYYDENSVLVTNRRKIFNRYVTSDFLVDMVPALPLSIMAWDSSRQVKAWLRLPKVSLHPIACVRMRRSLSS
jgi:hypothetical protein